MSDDILAKATRALREQTSEPDEAARFTRARVLSSVRARRVQRRMRVALLLPIAACFVAASAWGAATGKLHHVVERVEHVLGMGAPSEAVAPAEQATTRAPTPAVAPPAPAALEPAPAEPAASEPPPVAVVAAAPSSAPPALMPAPSSSAADGDPAFELYRTAHQAHFVDRNSAAALRAWDAYLSAAPSGQFALEARYNRALCLVKLGRSAEARTALQAFASGRYGAYRQHEATELLEALAPADAE